MEKKMKEDCLVTFYEQTYLRGHFIEPFTPQE